MASARWFCLGALLASGCGSSSAARAPEDQSAAASPPRAGSPADSGGEVFLWSLPLTVSQAARSIAAQGGSAEQVGRQLRLSFHLPGEARSTRELERRFPHLSIEEGKPSSITIAPFVGPVQPAVDERKEATFVIDYDEPSVQELFATVHDKTPTGLEAFVASTLEGTHGRGFDIASRVATLKKGDCTEHAVLLTALLRAAGHSARVVVGVVVLLGEGGMAAAGHAWVEVADGGVWRSLDAALLPNPKHESEKEDDVVKLYLPTVVLEDEGPSYGKDLIAHAVALTPQDLTLDRMPDR